MYKFIETSEISPLSFHLKYDVDDDRRAEEGADGGDGQRVGEYGADEVAEQQDVRPDEGGGGQGETMVRCAEDTAGDMRHRYADERNRSAIGGDTAGEQARGNHYPQPHTLHADAQAPRVLLTQRHTVEGLHQKQADEYAREHHRRKEW